MINRKRMNNRYKNEKEIHIKMFRIILSYYVENDQTCQLISESRLIREVWFYLIINRIKKCTIKYEWKKLGHDNLWACSSFCLANRYAPEEIWMGGLAWHRRLLVVGQIGHVRVRRRTLAVSSNRQRFHHAGRISIRTGEAGRQR